MAEKRIVVVGAGVSGLTTALLLSKNSRYKITVAAKHMPGDYDIEYASPWAGANYMPVSVHGTNAAKWDRNTWPPLEQLARDHPEAGVHFQVCKKFNRRKDIQVSWTTETSESSLAHPWWENTMPDFHQIPRDQLQPDIDNANEYLSVCINTAIYLPWLVSQCLKAGVVFKRAVFKHVGDAAQEGAHHSGRVADLVLNCTGLSSCKLGGVEDKRVYPVRGQIVLVRNDPGAMYSTSSCDDGEDEMVYIMKRAGGGGTVLGGCYQKHNWESQFDPNLAIRIMKRCVALCPQMTNGRGIEHLDIIRHGVGLRPVREGGARVEKEKIGGTWVVHNYGHGGAGYQSSYGCAQDAVQLVDEALQGGPRL